MHMEVSDAGLRLLERLRSDAETAQMGVIVCSADPALLEEKRSQADALGAAVARKPYDVEHLLATVAKLLPPR